MIGKECFQREDKQLMLPIMRKKWEVCKKKNVTIKVNGKNMSMLHRQQAKLDLNSQNTMLQKARFLAIRI